MNQKQFIVGEATRSSHNFHMASTNLKDIRPISAVDLFAGGGGLSLASRKVGVKTKAWFENDPHACATLRLNQHLYGSTEPLLFDQDFKKYDFLSLKRTIGSVDIVLGGPPCQPFSMGGQRKGSRDKRDLFDESIKFIKIFRPKAFLFENVPGLTAGRFHSYLMSLLHKLAGNEKYGRNDTRYKVYARVLNAADYGVAQARKRLFIVGLREDLGVFWHWPKATHSIESLLWSKYVTGEYFERHSIRPRRPSDILGKRIANFDPKSLDLRPALTLRDVIGDLEVRNIEDPLHNFVPGARVYHGHMGSELDMPSKTIKAGVNGCPGGENIVMIRGRPRYLTLREVARIQTFPDTFKMQGTRTQGIKRLGNAVPVELGSLLVSELTKAISGQSKKIAYSSHEINENFEFGTSDKHNIFTSL